MNACPAPEQWQQWLAQVLDRPLQEKLVAHLQSCPSCTQLLESLAQDEDTKWWRGSGSDAPPTDETQDARDGAPASRPNAVVVPGYEILEELGHGGMGIVYKASQVALKRTVAVKMLLGDFPGASELRERFRREAEAVAGLQHPNIVQIYEIGEHEGRLFFSMEYIDGGSLAQRLAGGTPPMEQVVVLSAVLARAIFHCHQRGIIHRDLKPANVLLIDDRLAPEGWIPKISDFGLAKQLADDAGKTRSGAVLGTPSYMAPEQAAGELIFGKLIPYLGLTLLEFCTILTFMRVVFQVPIHGHVVTLLLLTLPFVFTFLGLGLIISTRVATREAAGQAAMGTMMPSIFLSGYVFPLDSMWPVFQFLGYLFPTTWLIDAARGVILRGAGWSELWIHSLVLWSMGIASFVLAMMKFRKRLT